MVAIGQDQVVAGPVPHHAEGKVGSGEDSGLGLVLLRCTRMILLIQSL